MEAEEVLRLVAGAWRRRRSPARSRVDGKLNKDGSYHDPHEGETGEKGLTEFHPAMNVDTAVESVRRDQDRVTKDIETFARGYSGKWQWKLGWGQNCHTFQQSMKSRVKLHYQTAKGWLEDPTARAKIAAKAKAAQDKAEADTREKSANLALVATAKKWYVWTEGKSIGTILAARRRRRAEPAARRQQGVRPRPARRGSSASTTPRRSSPGNGGRGWVSEMELKSFSNMGG